MKGRRILVTAGPTHEAIDPVRYIANRSSGKQGYAIAEALAAKGAEVMLVAGPTALQDPAGIVTVHVESAVEMLEACKATLPVDVGVFIAAVVDWRVESPSPEKIKKEASGKTRTLALVENPDILATISQPGPMRPKLCVGFAAETENVVEYAKGKRLSKGCDWILANDVSPGTGTFGGDSNTIHLITADGVEDWLPMSKSEVAERLATRLAEALCRSAAEGVH